MGNIIVVEGYSFTDEAMAKQARTEAQGVQYVRSRTDMSKPDQVFSIYHKLLEQKMFQTPIGYAYLKELQDYLKTMPGVHSEDIRPIPVASNLVVDDRVGITKRMRRQLDEMKNKLKLSIAANLTLAFVIVIMFVISATSGQTTILNYESSLQDEYAQWEQELQEREQAVREKEIELNMDTFSDDTVTVEE